MLSFSILKAPVIDPAVVNTVSNFKVSAERVTCASGLVIKDSFLQAKKRMQRDKIKRLERIFIDTKNNRRIQDYLLEKQNAAMLNFRSGDFINSWPQASRVAPVVIMSSTSNTCLFLIFSG